MSERVVSPALVGRSDELELLLTAVFAPPAMVVVEGEAGIGKTRLVLELHKHPMVAQHRLVMGGCRAIREPFPLGPVLEAIRGFGTELAPQTLSPVAGSLRPLLPELNDVLPPLPAPLDDRAGEQHRVFRGLVELLEALCPMTMVLEDLHWADEQTVDFIDYLVNGMPSGLSLVLTYRGDDVQSSVRAATARLPAPVSRRQITLAPLDAGQTGELAAAILGFEHVSEEMATYLCARTSGLPFAIEELLAVLREQGGLVHRSGSVTAAIDELDVPVGIRDPVLARFTHLTDAARAAVEAAAVLHVPVPARVLVATCDTAPSTAMSGIDDALASGLLVDRAGTVGFRHVLAALSIYEALHGPRLQQLHANAASALDLLDPPPLGHQAHHLRRAEHLADWVDVAEQAADQATELGHYDEAARLLEDVLRHAPLSAQRQGSLAVKLGVATNQVLHPNEGVIAILSAALEQDLPRTVRGKLRLQLAILLQNAGADFRPQRPLLAAAAEDLEGQPDLMAHAMLGLGLPTFPGVSLDECRNWLERVLELVPVLDDSAFQAFLLGKVAMVYVAVGDPQWRQLTDRIIEQTGGIPRQQGEANAYWSIGLAACQVGDLTTAERLLDLSRQGAEAAESEQLELRVRSAHILLDYYRGAWDGLADRVDALIDRLPAIAPGRTDLDVVAGCLALSRGELDKASRSLHDAMQRLEHHGAFDILPTPTSAMIRLTTGLQDQTESLAIVRRFLDTVEAVPFEVSAVRALPAVIDAMLAAGRPGEAWALTSRWERKLHGLDAPLAPAALSHAWGMLEAGSTHSGVAAHHLLAAADQYEWAGCSYDAAQARERAALSLFHAGDRSQGDDQLRAALLSYHQLGATWDLDRASRTARERGVSVPARHRRGRLGYGEQLSPREREVAELVTSGRTNREIAETLHVSLGTVKKHLANAMRKLDVNSRLTLIRRFDGHNWNGTTD